MTDPRRALKFLFLMAAFSLTTTGFVQPVGAAAADSGKAGRDSIVIHLGAEDKDVDGDGVIHIGPGSRDGKVDISLGDAHVRVDQSDEGDVVLMGDDIFVGRDETIDGDVVAVGGSVTVLGKVYGNAVAIGGTLTLGDSAYVEGDAVSVGGGFERAHSARVDGEKVQIGFKLPVPWKAQSKVQSTFIEVIRWMVFYIVIFAFSALALFLGRDRIAWASDYLGREPFPSFLLGLLSPFLALVTFVLLIVTIIGIPVALALFFLYPIFMFLGWVVTGHRVGASVGHGHAGPNVRTVFIGLLVISGLHMLSVLLRALGVGGFPIFFLLLAGMIVSFTSALVGLGAILGTRFRRRPEPPAPPMPAPAPPPLSPMTEAPGFHVPMSPMAAPEPPAPPAIPDPPRDPGI